MPEPLLKRSFPVLCAVALMLGGCGDDDPPASAGEIQRGSEPLEIIEISLPQAFEEQGHAQPAQTRFMVTQESGPPAQAVIRPNGTLRIATPEDSGGDEELSFRVSGKDTVLTVRVSVSTLVGPTVTPIVESSGEEEIIGSSIPVQVKGVANGFLSKQLSTFAIQIGDAEHRPPAQPPSILLVTDERALDVSDLFEYSPQTGLVTVKAAGVSTLQTRLGTTHRASFILGGDDVASEIGLIYAPNVVRGRLIDAMGTLQSQLAGKRIVLRNLASGFRAATEVSATGQFEFSTVPLGTFLVELSDASTDAVAIGSFAIFNSGDELAVDVTVLDRMAGGTSTRSGASFSHGSIIREQKLPHALAQRPPEGASRSSAQAGQNCQDFTNGTFRVSSEDENTPSQCEILVEIPKGTPNLRLKLEVETSEFPGYSTQPNNPYNDSWHYVVRVGNTPARSESGQVNKTHNTTGSRLYIDECIDVSSMTESASSSLSVVMGSTNIGDSALPTHLTVTAFPNCTPGELQLSKAELGRTAYGQSWKLFFYGSEKGRNLSRYMSFPTRNLGYSATRFPLTLEYSPKEAELKAVKLEVRWSNGGMTLTSHILVGSEGPEQFEIEKKPGMLRVKNFLLPGASVPRGASAIELFATATGLVEGKEVTSTPMALRVEGLSGTLFVPLFEASQVLTGRNRFSGRDETLGLDGWGQSPVLDKLSALDYFFNDISAMHTARTSAGKSPLRHSGHGNGREVDLRYWDDAGRNRNTPMNGFIDHPDKNDANSAIVALGREACAKRGENNVIIADPAQNPGLARIHSWINHNRTNLAAFAGRPDVELIYVGTDGITKLLLLGKCPDSNDDLPGVGAWSTKPGHIQPMSPHHDHWHVNFRQE